MSDLSSVTDQTWSKTSPRPNAAKSIPSTHTSGSGQSDNQNQEEDQAGLETDAGDDRENDNGERLENKFDNAVTSKETEAKEKKQTK